MDHFSWLHANVFKLTTAAANPWEVFLDSSTEVEVESSVRLLKKGKSAGPDEIFPVLLFSL